ncbi:hypothetical protein OHB24_20610 [Kribbella sp. NBC_00482]
MSDCDKFETEVAKEIRIEKFTLAELEEEEQSLERLRRWHRDLTARDVFGTLEAADATDRLRQCAAACEDHLAEQFEGAVQPSRRPDLLGHHRPQRIRAVPGRR